MPTTITTEGLARIEDAAAAVREFDPTTADEAEEKYEALADAAEDILADLADLDFPAHVLFVDRVWQTWDTEQVVEQHDINTTDWRESLWDEYHIIQSAIREQASEPVENLSETETLEIPFDIDDVTQDILRTFDANPEATTEDLHAAGVPELTPMRWVVVLDHAADEYGFTSYDGMTDTAMRDKFTFSERPARKFAAFEEMFLFEAPFDDRDLDI